MEGDVFIVGQFSQWVAGNSFFDKDLIDLSRLCDDYSLKTILNSDNLTIYSLQDYGSVIRGCFLVKILKVIPIKGYMPLQIEDMEEMVILAAMGAMEV